VSAAGRYVFPLVIALVAVGPLSTDLYLPSLPAITKALNADVALAQLTLSAYMCAFAAVQLVYGPLSDRFGRRPIAIVGIAIYAIASLACALAPTIEALIWARAAQAAGACAGVVLGRAIVRDVYGRDGAARALAVVGSVMAFAPAIGPVLGGFVEVAFGWRWNFALLLAFAVVLFVGLVLGLDETNARKDPTATDPVRMLRNFGVLIGDRGYVGYALAVSFSYGGLFAFISGSSFVLIDVLGLSPPEYAGYFALCVLGYFTGTRITVWLNKSWGNDRMLWLGTSLNVAGGAIMLLVSVADLATPGLVGATLLSLPMMVYLIGMGIVLPNGQGAALGPYPTMAGAAAALMGFTQMSLAALVGIAFGQIHAGGTIALPILILGCGVAALTSFALAKR
jgi:MFS transporter, DHA1 family, multidrug resistance protein